MIVAISISSVHSCIGRIWVVNLTKRGVSYYQGRFQNILVQTVKFCFPEGLLCLGQENLRKIFNFDAFKLAEIPFFRLVLEGKTGKEILESSRLKFLEKFLVNNLLHQMQKTTLPSR